MTQKKTTALLFAAGACVLLAAWTLHDRLPASPVVVEAAQDAQPSRATILLRMPADATLQSPQPFHLDAAMARTAVRDGELRIALPDGTTYPVRIERQFTDETGHWNVVGRAQTKIGAQAMVLTLGANAVFGTLPMPDGTLMQITSGPDGVLVAPTGGIIPPGQTALPRNPDFRVPPKADVPGPRNAVPAARAAQRERLDGDAQPRTSTQPIARTAIASAAPLDTTPVDINVLALYGPDLVTLRGSADAAQTEVAHLFALANQAHLDSGTRVRLVAVGLQEAPVSITSTNEAVLNAVTQSPLAEMDTEALRDMHSADLVTIVRPYHDGDFSCGIAWLAGSDLARNNLLNPRYGYSVVDVAPCDPYVLAHELGHSMGSMHDRETSTDLNYQELRHGAYPFSFGYRNPDFATVMAYSVGQPRIGYFSGAPSAGCGATCGIPELADNVRSLNLMAPAIATFRGTPGTASISDVEVLEPNPGGQAWIYVPVRISMPAPVGGVQFQVNVTGGTATSGEDFDGSLAQVLSISEGNRDAYAWFRILGDDAIEPDETLQVHLTAMSGTPLLVTDAVATIVNEDPRPVVSGKLWIPADATPPTDPVSITLRGANGRDDEASSLSLQLYPPDFTYSAPVLYGAPLRVTAALPEHLALRPFRIDGIFGDLELPLMPKRTWTLSGQVRAALGTTLPSSTFPLELREQYRGMVRWEKTVWVAPPDYRYSVSIAAGSTLSMEYTAPIGVDMGNAVPYRAFLQHMAPANMTFDPVLSAQPTLYAWGVQEVVEGTTFGIVVQLTAPAPPGGVQFRYRTVDGTAKAGKDYIARSGTGTIAEGETRSWDDIQTTVYDNGVRNKPMYMDFVVEQVTGASPSVTRVRTWVNDNDLRTGDRLGPRLK